ncbi:MAG: hypothetical protein MJ240_09690 [Kiritimatiellae bacterium]|nr:hypothetical protein [Kiritimatiellia bacterium]
MTMKTMLMLIMCGIAAVPLFAADKTWHPTVQEGGLYKMGNAANWLADGAPTTAPADGESVIFDSSSAAISAYNDRAGLKLLRVTVSGTQAITLSGEKLVLCDQGGFFAEDAPFTVKLDLPIELAGTVFFSSISADTAKSTTYDFTGAIGDWDSIPGTLATGGDFSGIYNFRGANTYSGGTYITNGLSYNAHSDKAFGVGDVYYSVPNSNTPAQTRYGKSGGNFDTYYSTVYFHGVTMANTFHLAGRQLRDLVFVKDTVNTFTGSVCFFTGAASVERWEVQSNAKAVFTGPVAFDNVAQLNVSPGSALIFSNVVSCSSIVRAAGSGTGEVVFADKTRAATVAHYGTGKTLLVCPTDCGTVPPVFSYTYGGATLDVSGGMQSVKTFTDAASCICSSADGTTLRVTAASGQEAKTAFRGNVNLLVEGGVQNLSGISNTTGDLVATNGGQIVLAPTATWKQARAVCVHDGSSVAISAQDALRSGVEIALNGSGQLTLAAGAAVHASRLQIDGVALALDKSYGATGSGADIIDDVHFAGAGKLITDGAQSLVWTGAGGNLKFSTAANWSPACCPNQGDTLTMVVTEATTIENDLPGVHYAGLSFTGAGDCTIVGAALGLKDGGTFAVNGATTLTLLAGLDAAGSAQVTLTVGTGTTVKVPGVMSGTAPIRLAGEGTVYFSGDNTFSGDLTVNCRAFHAVGDGVFGTTDGSTTFQRLDANAYIYFDGGTTSEHILNRSVGSAAYWVFAANSRTVFNGPLELKSEQFRFSARANAQVVFNADFIGSMGYLTTETTAGVVFDFNCSFTGYPRPQGLGTHIFRKPVTYSPRYVSYCLDYGLSGIMRYAADYVLPLGATAPVFATANASTFDLDGHDQAAAELVGRSATITSDEPATLHVLNNYSSGYNGGVFAGVFAGKASLSCEGTEKVSTVTLSGASTSSGTLTASNGCAVVITASGRWSGTVDIAAGSVVTTKSRMGLGEAGIVKLATGGQLNLDFTETNAIAALWLDGVPVSNNETYGPVGSGADHELAGLGGTGMLSVEPPFVPVVGTVRTWRGPMQGTWSTAANWDPAGVPQAHDSLVFDSSAADIASVNDLSGLQLNGISFSGANPIVLSGRQVGLARSARVAALTSCATIELALPLSAESGSAAYIVATSNQTGHVIWNLTGGFAGLGDFHFGGDASAEVHFRANSPAFDGNLILTNAAAYHVWCNGAFGSTVGHTLHAVCRGDYSTNVEKWYEPLWFHGVTMAENFYFLAYSSFGVGFADGTTNVLSGIIDVPLGYYAGSVALNAERWWVGTNAAVTLEGPVGLGQLPDAGVFEHFIPYVQPYGSITFAGGMAAGGVRANGREGSTYRLDAPLGASCTYFGNYREGEVIFGCDNVLGAEPTIRFMFGTGLANVLNLNGHDQTLADLGYANSYTSYMTRATFTSATPATLHLMSPYDVAFSAKLTDAAGLTLQSPQVYTLTANNSSTGALTVANGATAVVAGAWSGERVLVAAESVLRLPNPTLSPTVELEVAAGATVDLATGVQQSVRALTLAGVPQAAFRTYGAPGSGADVTSACFTGLGRIFVMGGSVGQERTWKGGAGNWSVASNWRPEGVPQSGDLLVFDAAAAAVDAHNDLVGLAPKGIVCTGANEVSLSGNLIHLMDTGLGFCVTNGAVVTVSCAIASFHANTDSSVELVADAGTSVRFAGVLSGDAAWRVKGKGRVDFAGANTFTGPLAVGEAEFHAWGASPFGTADGKTSFSLPSGTSAQIHFHGVQTEDLVEWFQTDGANRGTIYAGEPTVFKGVFRGTGGQPRWVLARDSTTIFSNTVEGVGAFTPASDVGSVLDIVGAFSGGNLRFSGSGSCYVRDSLTLNGGSYALAFNDIAAKTIYLMATNALRTSESYTPYFGSSPLMIDGGTVDLCGNWQRAANFLGGVNAVLTSSSGPATLHVLQTSRGNLSPTTAAVYNGAFNGVVTGPVSLSIEGNPNPVPPDFQRTSANTLVPTQYLTAVSTATGSLSASNSAVIAFTEKGAWAGTNIMVHANSKILLDHAGALAREAELYLSDDGVGTSGKLVLGEGVVQRCQWLYVNGVRQPRGLYGSTESTAAIKNDAFFEGRGTLRIMGNVGMTINFR